MPRGASEIRTMRNLVKKAASLGALLLVTSLGLVFQPAVHAQDQTYNSGKSDYIVEFPSAAWRLIDEPDDVHQHTEFIYGDRLDGYLRIRKETLDQGLTVREFADRDQDQRTRFLPGFVNGKVDQFAGRMNGVTVSYEYTSAGKPMAGRTYYLQGDNNSVYVLRFTGLRDKLQRIRNQTDSIARSLRAK